MHKSLGQLEAGLSDALRSPSDAGVVEMIVRRPKTGERDVLQEGTLDVAEGLVGDNWATRGSSSTPDGSANRDMQLTLMNSRVIDLIAGSRDRWALAGDQLFVDLDLSQENLPAGTQIKLGSALLEVTSEPHTGCKKFVERFGLDALKFVSTRRGKQFCLRGINARVVGSGRVRIGDPIRKT